MIETEWVCELCGQTYRPCLCSQAGMGAKLYEEKMRKKAIQEEFEANMKENYDSFTPLVVIETNGH